MSNALTNIMLVNIRLINKTSLRLSELSLQLAPFAMV